MEASTGRGVPCITNMFSVRSFQHEVRLLRLLQRHQHVAVRSLRHRAHQHAHLQAHKCCNLM